MFSRNSSSSRAIPVERLIKDVMDDPAIPIHWGANQRGMQADWECDALVYYAPLDDDFTNREAWLAARNQAAAMAKAFSQAGYHKQIVNRLLEPFCHITTLISSTAWSNFFALRCHPAAQPEMRALADAIKLAIDTSTPIVRGPGTWHLPFVSEAEADQIDTDTTIRLSVARCARVSYETHEGKVPTVEQDLKLYDQLVTREPPEDGSKPDPIHASPAEHVATPNPVPGTRRDLSGNFDTHFWQYRKTLPNECL